MSAGHAETCSSECGRLVTPSIGHGHYKCKFDAFSRFILSFFFNNLLQCRAKLKSIRNYVAKYKSYCILVVPLKFRKYLHSDESAYETTSSGPLFMKVTQSKTFQELSLSAVAKMIKNVFSGKKKKPQERKTKSFLKVH